MSQGLDFPSSTWPQHGPKTAQAPPVSRRSRQIHAPGWKVTENGSGAPNPRPSAFKPEALGQWRPVPGAEAADVTAAGAREAPAREGSEERQGSSHSFHVKLWKPVLSKLLVFCAFNFALVASSGVYSVEKSPLSAPFRGTIERKSRPLRFR